MDWMSMDYDGSAAPSLSELDLFTILGYAPFAVLKLRDVRGQKAVESLGGNFAPTFSEKKNLTAKPNGTGTNRSLSPKRSISSAVGC